MLYWASEKPQSAMLILMINFAAYGRSANHNKLLFMKSNKTCMSASTIEVRYDKFSLIQ